MMKEYPTIGERLFRRVLPNGLTVVIVPREGFTRKIAYFVTDFGSIHTDFELDGKQYHVPAGVAHFLEHKMFELPDRDVMGEFSARGAHVNAFTSYDMTAYYFSCTQFFEENLRLLLEFVSTPYFEEESVRREQGIIDQEIGRSEDAPESRQFEELMRALYRIHPVKVPILGDRKSIRQITPEILHLCHRAFYTPANMILCVVGDVQPESICQMAAEVLGDEYRPAGRKLKNWEEDLTAGKDRRMTMEVAMPGFEMGFKCESAPAGREFFRQDVIGDFAAEALFGESSALYLRLYEDGLIDSSFGGGFESIDGCAIFTCGGDSEDAYAVRDAIMEQARIISREGIDQTDFMRMKRSAMGRRIRDLDNFDSVCFRICAYHAAGFDYFDFPSVYDQVQAKDVQEFIGRVICQERCALVLAEPPEE